MLQCVAVCGSVLQCVAVCCSLLQCVVVCCGVVQHMLKLLNLVIIPGYPRPQSEHA